ncbi:MAG: hypothetical protein ACREJ9_03605 [Candidatus Rokuibacteriota bacterium]
MLSVCPHDCPSACSLVVRVEDGRLLEVTGNPDHSFTQGVICGKVRAYAERVHSPLRVLHPLRRVGAKGEGRFERISWEAAIAEIADRSSAAGGWPCRPCHRRVRPGRTGKSSGCWPGPSAWPRRTTRSRPSS